MLFQPRILLLSIVSAITLSACNPPEVLNITASQGAVAATVNGTPITESRVDMLLKQRAAQGQASDAETRQAIIEQLSMQLLLSKEAVKQGLDKSAGVADQLDLTRQSILATAFVQDHLKKNEVTDEMLKAEYDKIKDQIGGSEYKARHILVAEEADAKDIIARLKSNPGAFAALAREKSLDAGSKSKGGDLGWFDPRGMVPEFAEAVVKLTKGQFSDEPVKSQFGYHVILVEDMRSKDAPEFEQIKPSLQQKMQQQTLKTLLDDLKAKAKIEIVQAAVKDTVPDGEHKTPATAE